MRLIVCLFFVPAFCLLSLNLKLRLLCNNISFQTSRTFFFLLSHILTFHLHLFPFSSCLVLSFLHLLVSFDLITWFSPSNRFTYTSSRRAPSPWFSPSPSFSISIFELYPFIPYLLHPLQSSSVLHCGGKEREGESFSLPAVCRGRASEEPACRWWCTLGLWNLKELKPEVSGTRSCSAAEEEKGPRCAWERWVSSFALLFRCFLCCWRMFGVKCCNASSSSG